MASGRQTIKQRIALDGGKEIEAELKELGKVGEQAFKKLQQAAGELKGPPGAFMAGLKAVQAQLKAMGASFEKVGKQIQGVGKNFSLFVTTPIVTGLAASAKAAIDFESAMADVRKVVDFPTPEAFKEMSDDISKMSLRLPIAAEGLAAIAAAAGQAGIGADDLTQFTELVAKASVAFELTAEDAGNALAKIKTALGLSIPEVELLSDALNQLANNAATSEAEVLDIVARVGALGKMSGVSVNEIAALGSAMVSMGVDSERAATGLRNILLRMQAGEGATDAQREAWNRLGLDSVKVAKDIQKRGIGAILDVFERINKQAPHVRTSILNALFGERVVDAAGPLIANLSEVRRQLSLVQNEADFAGSTAREFGVRAETTANKMQLFVNQVSELRREFGEEMLPVLTKIIEEVRNLLSGFADLDSGTKQIIITMGLLAAAVGPALIALGSLVRVLGFVGRHPVIAGLTLIGTLIGGWAGYTALASSALERHEKLVGSVKEAYAAAGHEVAKMTQEVRDRLFIETSADLKNMKDEAADTFEDLVATLRKGVAGNPILRPLVEEFAAGQIPLQDFLDTVAKIGRENPALLDAANGILTVSKALGEIEAKSQGSQDFLDLLTGKITDAEYQARQMGGALVKTAGDIKGVGNEAAEAATKVEDLGRKVTVTKFGGGGDPVKQVFDLVDGVAKAADASKEALDRVDESADATGKKLKQTTEQVFGVIRSVPEEFRSQPSLAEEITRGLPEATEQVRVAVQTMAGAAAPAKAEIKGISDEFVAAGASGQAAFAGIPAAAKQAVDGVAAEVARVGPAMAQAVADASTVNEIAAALIKPFQDASAAIDKIFSEIAAFASRGFNSVMSEVRKIASEIDRMIASIISALRRAAAEAARLRAQAQSDGAQRRAGGGYIRGPGTGTSDSIPAWLSNGEFVIRAAAVRKFGAGFFAALNSLRMPQGFNMGGLVRGFQQSMASLSPAPMRFADGGLVAAPAGSAGRPVTLNIGGEVFDMMADNHVVDRLQRFATTKGLRSAGRKPGWVGA